MLTHFSNVVLRDGYMIGLDQASYRTGHLER